MRLLTAVRPTDNQKRVLAKIIAAATPTVAAEEISKDTNLVAARDMLMKLNVISLADGEASLTDIGRQIAQDENLADQSGQLTDDGQKYAYTDSKGQQTSTPANTMAAESAGTLLKQLLR